LKLNKLVGH